MLNTENDLTVSILPASEMDNNVRELGSLLHACVHAGASVGFVLPYPAAQGESFWRDNVGPAVLAGTRLLFVARRRGQVVGSVQLDVDTPPNQPHRAEVRKLLVHPDARRRGVARLLMAELEVHAARLGRTLLTLDTRSGDNAEPLYASMGYTVVGAIPGYCRDTADASRFDATTIMYKHLANPS
ncbi:MAG: family N-acetyltransferase [Massilia sp.]|nr:family N-acetyltransferase [Massilia sp.]